MRDLHLRVRRRTRPPSGATVSTAYGDSALDRECAALARMTDGRHAGLCRATFVIGQLVGAGAIGRDEAERGLLAAACANGYGKKRGEKATRATIRTGLDAGASKPRHIDGRQRPSAHPEVRIAADLAKARRETPQGEDEAKRERDKALWLWRQRRPIAGTVAEVYLRETRGYSGAFPATLGFLPGRGDHSPALIAAFGVATEPVEPGVLAIDDADVRAVQLVRLAPDRSGKADREPNKIIIGKGALGSPIVCARPNDLLGLAICEGVEDALSVHEATGLGAWASAGAARMPALADAVPSYIDCVNIFGDDDDAGRRYAPDLAARLRARGIEVILKFLRSGSATWAT